ncbi:MAG: hypothetical protein LBQ88_03050 [Treponema sp.]|nr:hypothetical protein [Treponema sp.]
MKELVKKGHKVYFIGNEHSKMTDIGVVLIPCKVNEDWRLRIPKNTDIVQLFQNSAEIDIPSLNTIEGNEKAGTVFPENTVFVSKNHAQRHHAGHYIYNGIDLDEYPFVRKRKFANRNYLFLANGRWNVKNLKDCIRVSHHNRKHLYVAGAGFMD